MPGEPGATFLHPAPAHRIEALPQMWCVGNSGAPVGLTSVCSKLHRDLRAEEAVKATGYHPTQCPEEWLRNFAKRAGQYTESFEALLEGTGCIYLFIIFFLFSLWSVYCVLSISTVQQSDPVTHTHTHTHTHICILFSHIILFFSPYPDDNKL